MWIVSNELIQEEIQDLNSIGDGEYWLKNLVLVGRSDNMAQNEKMTDKVERFCLDRKIKCIKLPFVLEDVLNRNCKVIAVLDRSLADAIYNELKVEN